MPGPYPGTIWIERIGLDLVASFESYFWHAQNRNRRNRAAAILRRERAGDWCCRWCGTPLHYDKRGDARYCREGCRKAAARARRLPGDHYARAREE